MNEETGNDNSPELPPTPAPPSEIDEPRFPRPPAPGGKSDPLNAPVDAEKHSSERVVSLGFSQIEEKADGHNSTNPASCSVPKFDATGMLPQ